MNPETDRWIRSDEARAKLRDLLDRMARDGIPVYILRYDKPLAVIVPVDWYEDARIPRPMHWPAWMADRAIKAADTQAISLVAWLQEAALEKLNRDEEKTR